jgi:hypothetical protein
MNFLLPWRHIRALVIIDTVLVYAPCAMAHKTSYGYLKADFAGDAVSGKLELAVRDFDFAFFDFAFGPGADGGGKVNWDQLHRHEQEIAGLLLNKISIGPPGAVPSRPRLYWPRYPWRRVLYRCAVFRTLQDYRRAVAGAVAEVVGI